MSQQDDSKYTKQRITCSLHQMDYTTWTRAGPTSGDSHRQRHVFAHRAPNKKEKSKTGFHPPRSKYNLDSLSFLGQELFHVWNKSHLHNWDSIAEWQELLFSIKSTVKDKQGM